MKRARKLSRSLLIPFVLLFIFLVQPARVAYSQTSTISGVLHIGGIYGAMEIPFTFDPHGGPMVFGSGSVREDLPPNNVGDICYGISSDSGFSATFAGGDGGEVSGSYIESTSGECGGKKGSETHNWTFTGHLKADGTGSGWASCEIIPYGDWTATYSAAEFQAALQPVITSEYIYTTYGIRVEDSFGDDQYAQKAWSDHELVLLNDVLKSLPPGFIGKISLDRIVRNVAKITPDGTPNPKVYGTYYPCDRQTDAKCNGSKPTIRIFDLAATNTADFPGDNDREFKASILHEIIHAYQYHKDGNTIYKNPYDSPQTLNYEEATRPLKGEDAHKWQNGWKYYDPPKKWTLFTYPNDQPPTAYGKGVNPLEDMSESVMMYVYDPARLKAASPARYDYIRDNILAGAEYENGNPK